MAVIDHMRSASLLRELNLLLRRRSTNDIRAHSFQQLTEPETRSTSGSVDKYPVALVHMMSFPNEGQCGEALQKPSSRDLRFDAFRQLVRFCGGGGGIFCVCALAHPHDFVAFFDALCVPTASFDDGALALSPENVGP